MIRSNLLFCAWSGFICLQGVVFRGLAPYTLDQSSQPRAAALDASAQCTGMGTATQDGGGGRVWQRDNQRCDPEGKQYCTCPVRTPLRDPYTAVAPTTACWGQPVPQSSSPQTFWHQGPVPWKNTFPWGQEVVSI